MFYMSTFTRVVNANMATWLCLLCGGVLPQISATIILIEVVIQGFWQAHVSTLETVKKWAMIVFGVFILQHMWGCESQLYRMVGGRALTVLHGNCLGHGIQTVRPYYNM